jgi:hypothetical protein
MLMLHGAKPIPEYDLSKETALGKAQAEERPMMRGVAASL